MNNTYLQRESRRIDIARNTAVSIPLQAGNTIRCVDGQIWLTQEGDWRDYCLVSGVSFCADRKGKAVLSAVGGKGAVVVERSARAMAPGTVRIHSLDAVTRGAREAQAQWIARVLATAAAQFRARMRALLIAIRTGRLSRYLAGG